MCLMIVGVGRTRLRGFCGWDLALRIIGGLHCFGAISGAGQEGWDANDVGRGFIEDYVCG